MPAPGRRMILWQIALGAAFLGAWQWGASAGALDKFFFSRPSDVLGRVFQWLIAGSIWTHLGVTLAEAFLSFAIGVLLGVVCGFVLARVPFLGALFDPYIRIANALPRVALAPIFLLWFGLGIWSKVALGVTVVFFIVFFNTFQGVREVDPLILNNARMLGASERQLIRHVLIPSALTWIFSSLHISIGFAIIAVVVGEYLGSSKGIGYTIAQAEGVFDTTGVFAGMTLLAAVVLIVGAAVNRLERWLLRWKPPPSSAEPPLG
ncbi:MAG: ABC transporter permease [Acidobacteria bacterium]|nr:ABC transporter permease [Acidobacteriota bacterium]